MFDSSDYPKSLKESQFEDWLETGRASKLSYAYLAIIWDELEGNYFPAFVENREDLEGYGRYGQSFERQTLVAAYDLYSESRVK
ncbi:hypothetical protein DFQ04_1380 [Algoriphagus boseongensis]|uniref:Uncharacterized protein n=1 Tax=Algoriphagus boseongensis TaxID=1442587 RepID=A0A4V3D2M9_9BACT|nr:hypothetical protein [Algoriphagus boseongensis]TDQ19557.1 hypothetical protein DFQ04_1380 [Algoriphagus boseongensis]